MSEQEAQTEIHEPLEGSEDFSTSNDSSCEYVGFTIESGHDEAQGRRETMEDAHVIIDNALQYEEFGLSDKFDSNRKIALYGIFDGHGGVETAQLVEKLLPKNIFTNEEFIEEKFESAIYNGFKETDSIVVDKSNEEGWMNGSTAVITLIVDDKLYVANIGDSEACLVSDFDGDLLIQDLTVPHKASDPAEKKRIENLGGHVFFGRVFGTLAVSRSFGDSKFKKPKTTQDFVSWEPAISSHEITPSHKFLVLACDGLWDVMSQEEVAQFVYELRMQEKDAQEICRELVKEAIRKKTEDNVTIILVFFNWEKKPAEELEKEK